jgi:S1-C subfamily serine protease
MFWPEPAETSFVGETTELDEEEEDLSRVLDSIVKVHCTHSEPDYIIPWQKQQQTSSTSSGFVIDIASSEDEKNYRDHGTSHHENNSSSTTPPKRLRVMTNAHSVEYGTMIQVQRRGGERKYQATIEVLANECDLAILSIESTEFWQDLHPLEFGPLPALQEEVDVIGYPTGGESLSITSGVVSRIEMQEYSQASTHLLAIQVDSAINAGNSGGPVVNDEQQVIGVAFQGLVGAENIGYVVPVTVVQHILHGLHKQRTGDKYTGFCSLGIITARLENESFRKSLGMLNGQNNLSGLMVQDVVPTSLAKGILQPNDVVLQVDGISVGNDGKIPFRRGERVSLSCYIQTKFVNDIVKVKVWRNKQEVLLDVPVGIYPKLVPAHFDNQPPPYVIVGGLVFTALSVPYLFASEAWESYVSDSVSYLLGKWRDPVEQPTDQLVLLSHVLAHKENLGYDTLGDLHLEKINNQKVRSLAHMKHLIDECTEEFLRFEFAPNNYVVVLERCHLDNTTKEVCEEHSIPKPFFLHTLQDTIEQGVEGAVQEKTDKDSSLTVNDIFSKEEEKEVEVISDDSEEEKEKGDPSEVLVNGDDSPDSAI